MIPDSVVEEVRARADLVEIIGEHVSLKRAGKEFKSSCPFHDDRTPSFYVVPDKGFYKCFGCGESGDVFAFLMKRSGLDFVEAVKEVGRRCGVEVEEVGKGREEDPHRELHEANAFARDFFREALEGDGGEGARRYLDGRGVDPETRERFTLGLAPDGWRNLREAAARHGIEDRVLLEVGLLTTSERSAEPYDRFRNRIVFPIEGVTGKVVAFGGRALGSEGPGVPKYLNSPESPVYHKGWVLYGLSRARHPIRREEVGLLVEGYMDVVSLAAAGVETAVATLGTALTPDQAALLSRYTSRVLILFDSDDAGLRASFRAGDALLAHRVHPSVVTLPPGEDPDSLVRREGPEGLRPYLDGAVDLLDRKLQILEERNHFASIDKTRQAVDRLLPTLRAAADPALRDLYVAKVADRTGVRRETLEEEMARKDARGRPVPSGGRSARPGAARRSRSPAPPISGMGAERKVLHLLLRARERVEDAAERIGPEDFHDPSYREIFQALISDPSLQAPTPGMSPTATRRFQELLDDPEELLHAGRVFEESVARIRGRSLDRRQEELDRRLERARSQEERRSLVAEKARLRRERNEIGVDWSAAARRSLKRGDRDSPP